MLEFEIGEIKSAQLNDINEEENLLAKREILLNKKDLIENTSLIYEIISGEGQNNLIFNLSQIKKLLANSSEFDKSFEPHLETIETIISEIKELSSFSNSYAGGVDWNEGDLDEFEDRLDLFYDLKRKYGKTLVDILEYYEKIQMELKGLKSINISQEDLKKSFKQKEEEINILAEKLTKSREKITENFVNKINEELQTLGFKHALFVVEFTECELSQNGKEQIQFLFTANPDEPPKPLLKVASGGELSRIMLAIKSIVCSGQYARTMIFDEIDMGVSGEIASSVAKKLYKISRQNQVLCITHQPILCAMADAHFVIEKTLTGGITHVTIKEVPQNEKAEALATLLTPDKKRKDGITEDAKMFARSLLENARRIKEKELVFK
jgi:DNA repair protein RecN (Recombination protein N)